MAATCYLQNLSEFVISTEAKRSGETCCSTARLRSQPKHLHGFHNQSQWKRPTPLCHLDRSEAEWRDLQFPPTPSQSPEKHPQPKKICHLDRSEAERRDLLFYRTLSVAAKHLHGFHNQSQWKRPTPLCHLDRSEAEWRDLQFRRPQANLPFETASPDTAAATVTTTRRTQPDSRPRCSKHPRQPQSRRDGTIRARHGSAGTKTKKKTESRQGRHNPTPGAAA